VKRVLLKKIKPFVYNRDRDRDRDKNINRHY